MFWCIAAVFISPSFVVLLCQSHSESFLLKRGWMDLKVDVLAFFTKGLG